MIPNQAGKPINLKPSTWTCRYSSSNFGPGLMSLQGLFQDELSQSTLLYSPLSRGSQNTWNARRSNQSILKEINSEYSLEGMNWIFTGIFIGCWSWSSNTLATWWEELIHWKRPWCWERLKAGGEGGNRGWDGWMASLTQWMRVWADSGKIVKNREVWRAAVHGVAKSQTGLSD